jgi:endoglucanase
VPASGIHDCHWLLAALAALTAASGCNGSGSDGEAGKPDAAAEAGPPGAPPLSTCGRFMVDAGGRRVKLAGVNWYGASDTELVVGGLDLVSLDRVVSTIRELGFNTVRLPFSHEMLHASEPVERTHVAANPELEGKTPLEVYDHVIDALTAAGIFVIPNSHTNHAMWCCGLDDDGVWYSSDYPEEAFMQDWEMLAQRYASNRFVVGADLRNELRPALGQSGGPLIVPSWGGGGAADWHAAATRAGNRVLAKNPNLVIFVEGLDSADNLTGVRDLPVVLDVPHKLAYESHQYSFFPSPPGDFRNPYGGMDAAGVKAASYAKWGYIMDAGQPYTAPVLLGEFGDSSQTAWMDNLEAYMRELDIDYTYWPLNGGPKASGDSEPYGLLEDDWTTVRRDGRIDALELLESATRGPGIDAPIGTCE